MKYGGKMLICLGGGLALCIVAHAVTTEPQDNPYQSIVDRNVFSLKPPPPPPDPEATKAPPVKITLTGITTILGNKRALMKSPAPPGKPGEPAKSELSYILTVGQREGDIEVLDIDVAGGNVKLRNAGVEVTLNIDKDGPKLAPTPVPGMPGVPGVPGAVPPMPGGPRGFTPPTPTGNPGFTMPTRTLRLPPAGTGGAAANASATGVPGAGFVPGVNPGYTASPNASAGQPTKTWPPESNVSREEQMILIEAQRQQYLEQGNRAAAGLLPNTGLTGDGGSSGPHLPQ